MNQQSEILNPELEGLKTGNKRSKILVVDDNKTTMVFVKRVLDPQNYDMIEALSGNDAFALIEKLGSEIDVVLLDILIPDINGFEMLDLIKQNQKTKYLKVIMLTAIDQVDYKVRAFSRGASDYITKPFQKEELLARIETQIRLKRVEEDLKQEKERYEELFEGANEFIFTTDINGFMRSINVKAEESIGYSKDEFIGMNILNLTHPDDRDKCYEFWRKVRRGERPTYELSVYTKKGDIIYIRVTGRPIEIDGTVVEIQYNAQDITRYKQEEELLQKEKNFAKSVLQSQQDIVFVVDLKGMILQISDVTERLLGYEKGEFIGKSAAMMFPPDRLLEMMKLGPLKCIRGEIVTPVELILQARSGEQIPVQFTGSPVRDVNDKIIAAIGVGRDLRDQKKAEKEREKMQKELIDISRRAGMAEVATGVLHNVGNVLNSVNVSATLIRDKVRNSKSVGLTKATSLMDEHRDDLASFFTEDEKGKKLFEYLEKLAVALADEKNLVISEVNELTKNIDHIKEIVSLQQSHAKMIGVVETLSLFELVDDALKFNEASMKRHGIEIVKEYGEVEQHLTTEKQKVLQILVNLLSNAKRALDDCPEAQKCITLRVMSNGDEGAIMEVGDNGMGISNENLKKIFAHGFTTKKDGHGFGLHSSALSAKELGGTLTAHSDGPGHGATFRLELPYKLSEENT